MLLWCLPFLFVCLGLFVSENVGYMCMENLCECTEQKIVVCSTLKDERLLDLEPIVRLNYLYVVVSPDMSCDDIKRLELRTHLTVINRKCNNSQMRVSEESKDDMVENKMKAQSTFFWSYIIEPLELFLVLFTLFLSAKTRHNILPFIKQLPQVYTSNKTFIKNMFKKGSTMPNFQDITHNSDTDSNPTIYLDMPTTAFKTSTPRDPPQIQASVEDVSQENIPDGFDHGSTQNVSRPVVGSHIDGISKIVVRFVYMYNVCICNILSVIWLESV